MSKTKKPPKSQFKQYQTQSRAGREEQAKKPGQTWLVVGGIVVPIALLTAVYLFNSRSLAGEPIRPLANIPAPTRNDYYPKPPEMSINASRDYQATIVTEKGNITLDLFEAESPITVNNFVFLAQQGFYDGVTFHRVLESFMAQTGDPSGTGAGGPGYTFEDEVNNGLSFDRPGLLAMANAGPNTNGSQFFITLVPTPHLDGRHTIFGEVVEGMEVLNLITRRDPQANPDFAGDLIERINITEK